MDVESSHPNQEINKDDGAATMSKGLRRALVVLNFVFMVLGNTGSPLLLRLYFRSGGKRQWFSSWLETAGTPLILLPLLGCYVHRSCRRQRRSSSVPLFFITPRLGLACAVLGLLTGLDDFLYAYGLAFLPLSTTSLLISTHLVFTALFAFLVVKQRFTAYSINAVALLTVGAVILGLHVNGDRPEGESRGKYFLGFALTLGAAALYGLVLPLVELMYVTARRRGLVITYTLVLEMQLVMGMFATAFCTVGMIVNHDFQAIPREARNFDLGEFRYYVVVVWNAIFWQFFFVGAVGTIFCVNTLLAGILIAVFLPVTEVLAVVFFHEKFSSEKAVALVLSLWGLASYSYGEYRRVKVDDNNKANAAVTIQQPA